VLKEFIMNLSCFFPKFFLVFAKRELFRPPSLPSEGGGCGRYLSFSAVSLKRRKKLLKGKNPSSMCVHTFVGGVGGNEGLGGL